MPAAQGKNWGLWGKMIIVGVAIAVGGPALTMWVTPSEEELRKKYNPDLRKRSEDPVIRQEKQDEFEDFVTQLKRYSKSDKPIWVVAKEEEERRKKRELQSGKLQQKAADARREEMRKEAGLDTK